MTETVTRAQVMHQVAMRELDTEYREWLMAHSATDAEGFHVVCSFAPHESALSVFREVHEYGAPVIIATQANDRLAMFQMVDIPANTVGDREVLHLTGEDFTIADVCRAVLADEWPFAVEFAPGRVALATP